jgi:hypothetical protein
MTFGKRFFLILLAETIQRNSTKGFVSESLKLPKDRFDPKRFFVGGLSADFESEHAASLPPRRRGFRVPFLSVEVVPGEHGVDAARGQQQCRLFGLFRVGEIWQPLEIPKFSSSIIRWVQHKKKKTMSLSSLWNVTEGSFLKLASSRLHSA